MIKLAPFNKAVPQDVQDLVKKAEADIEAGKLHPFTGPMKDNDGKERLAAGKTITDDDAVEDGLLRRGRAGQAAGGQIARAAPAANRRRDPPDPRLRLHARAEFDVDRCRRVDERAEFELAVGGLNAKDRDGVGVLVGRVEECSRRVDVHPARPFPARRFPADHAELAGVRVDLVHGHAVVAAIRVVEEPSVRVDADLGGRVRGR